MPKRLFFSSIFTTPWHCTATYQNIGKFQRDYLNSIALDSCQITSTILLAITFHCTRLITPSFVQTPIYRMLSFHLLFVFFPTVIFVTHSPTMFAVYPKIQEKRSQTCICRAKANKSRQFRPQYWREILASSHYPPTCTFDSFFFICVLALSLENFSRMFMKSN